MFLNFFLLMEYLGAMADPRYTGFREITDRDVLELHYFQFRKRYLSIYIDHFDANWKSRY